MARKKKPQEYPLQEHPTLKIVKVQFAAGTGGQDRSPLPFGYVFVTSLKG